MSKPSENFRPAPEGLESLVAFLQQLADDEDSIVLQPWAEQLIVYVEEIATSVNINFSRFTDTLSKVAVEYQKNHGSKVDSPNGNEDPLRSLFTNLALASQASEDLSLLSYRFLSKYDQERAAAQEIVGAPEIEDELQLFLSTIGNNFASAEQEKQSPKTVKKSPEAEPQQIEAAAISKKIKGLTLYSDRVVSFRDLRHELTQDEYLLLSILMDAPDTAISTERAYDAVLGKDTKSQDYKTEIIRRVFIRLKNKLITTKLAQSALYFSNQNNLILRDRLIGQDQKKSQKKSTESDDIIEDEE